MTYPRLSARQLVLLATSARPTMTRSALYDRTVKGRRRLFVPESDRGAVEFGMSVSAIRRAVAQLISEGILSAEDKRNGLLFRRDREPRIVVWHAESKFEGYNGLRGGLPGHNGPKHYSYRQQARRLTLGESSYTLKTVRAAIAFSALPAYQTARQLQLRPSAKPQSNVHPNTLVRFYDPVELIARTDKVTALVPCRTSCEDSYCQCQPMIRNLRAAMFYGSHPQRQLVLSAQPTLRAVRRANALQRTGKEV